MLIILSGVAGSGKDTIKVELMKRNPKLGTIKSYTTRAPRDNKDDLDRYFFVSQEEFVDLIEKEKLYEYSIHHDNYYGTSKDELDGQIANGKIVIKDIDVNETRELMDIFKDELKTISIFLKVKKEELYQRLLDRGETPENAERRLARLEYEESMLTMYDYVVHNDNLEKTLNIIERIIEEEYKLKQ